MPTPLSREKAIALYFMEHRAKVIDIAAFLDRVDRADANQDASSRSTGSDAPAEDFRMRALRDAITILIDGRPDRARRVLELFSDPTNDPIDRAGVKGAAGAWPARP